MCYDPSISQTTGKDHIMAGYIDVDAAIKVAQAALKRKGEVLKEIDVVRSDLRHADEMGSVTPEQRRWIKEQFPIRERNRNPKNKASAQAA